MKGFHKAFAALAACMVLIVLTGCVQAPTTDEAMNGDTAAPAGISEETMLNDADTANDEVMMEVQY